MLIAIPYNPECDENDEWDMLMRDLRDDVPSVHLMPACRDTNPTREVFRGIDAWVFRFDVSDELRDELLNSAYAQCPDLIIE